MPTLVNHKSKTRFQVGPLLLPIFAFGLAFCLVGCEGASTDTDNATPDAALTAQENMIQNHLSQLLQREHGAFLVVSSEDEALLVQFTGSDEDDIVADLPLKWLTDEQLSVARSLFADAGASGDQLPSRDAAAMFPALAVNLGTDSKHAARFAASILEDVYQLSPTQTLEFETEED